ncbi:MAG: DEAD/DEAH box helicase, partial [Betaproteobacteria bacterium]|nr:DEAD/DEAH box helicase [Betaproteobacteria bacterium]
MPVVRVAIPVPLPQLFDYLAEDATTADIGRCVRVPFGRGEKSGLILALPETAGIDPAKLKPVIHIQRDVPRLPPDWMDLVDFTARYYHAPPGEAVALALPPGLLQTKPARAWLAACAIDARERHHTGALPTLTAGQADVLAACRTAPAGFVPWLLAGVTGSGKTEIYLRLAADTLAAGRQVLMLVPEIALTPQLEERVRTRFPAAHIVSLHSELATGKRARGFRQALDGQADIVLGTRLAVFTPLPRLGLILIDEEHDASYKQQEGIRYSARDLAVWRAHQCNVPVVLGSATPSLESWRHAQNGHYRLLRLPARALSSTLPAVKVIDTR